MESGDTKREEDGMGSFMNVLKQDKGARLLFIMFAIMIALGIACIIFAVLRPPM